MAALSFAAAIRALADGDRAPTWYVTGDEDVLQQEVAAALSAAATDPSTRDFNADVRQAGDLTPEAFVTLVETPPMLAEYRVVVIRGLEQWRSNAKVWQALYRYLERPNPTTLLLMIHGAGEPPDARLVTAVARHVQVAPPSPGQRAAWLARRARARNIDLPADAAQHLIAAVGDDLALLGTELDKLAAGAADGAITLEQVQEAVGVRRGETLPDWVDAVLLRDTPRAVALVDVVLPQSGISGVRMVMALGTGLIGTRLARGLLDKGSKGRAVEEAVLRALRQARPRHLRAWGAEARRWTEAAGHWTGRELDAALRHAWQADGALKDTTLTDERGALMSLILALVPDARAA